MKPLVWNELKGNWAPVLIPWLNDNRIDYSRLRDQIAILLESGVDGIYTNGTSSEFYNQTEDEFDEISLIIADYCNRAGKAFQLGVSHPSPWASLQRLRRIAPLQPGAVQIVLPDWFPLNDDETLDFFQRMAEAAHPVGLVLYNPSFAKRVLQPEDWRSIHEQVPSFIGVKVGGGGDDWYRRVRECARGLSVFVPGHHLASGMRRGAHGAYSNVACLNPSAAQRWTDGMRTDMESALELESRIQAFMRMYIEPWIVDRGYSHQAADRLLAMIGGWCDISPALRWPYRSIPRDEADRIRPHARDLLPEFF
ncbi:MAG: dihydrodipicolinate synthase family protein [bacterium]|nr:dihydrodipicolinate synthase family protein [bacterium]